MWMQFFFLLLSKLPFLALHFETEAYKKPLSLKEETACFEAMRAGDSAARDRLIEHNLRLVAHMVKKKGISQYETEDFLSIGTIGLIKAVDNFDSSKGTKFSTYAARCVENEILMAFRKYHTDTSREEFDVGDDGDVLSLLEIIADDIDIESDFERYDFRREAVSMLRSELSPRERTIMRMRFGIESNNGVPISQSAIAKQLRISRSYVSRIEKIAIKKLQHSWKRIMGS